MSEATADDQVECEWCFQTGCSCRTYLDYGNSLTPAQQREEHEMIARHVAETDTTEQPGPARTRARDTTRSGAERG